jgi:hypothetical protein
MDATTLLSLLLLGSAISALTAGVKTALPEGQFKQRTLPLVPLLLGAFAGLVAPSLVPGPDAASHVVWGLLAGAFSGQLYEVFKRQFNAVSSTKKGGADAS